MMKKFMVPTLVAIATVIAFYACKKDVKSNPSNESGEEIATKPPQQQPTGSSCLNYQIALTRTYAGGQTTFTWCITNPNPGNGSGGTIQNLSHWDFIPGCAGDLGLEQNWSDIVSASYSTDGTTWNTITPTPILTPDPSQSCSNANVFKFNYGTSGSTATCYRLVLQGNYAQDNNTAVFKSGANTGCCVRTVPGIGCKQDFCSYSQGLFFASPHPWPVATVTVGGYEYTEAEGRAIWGCSNAGGLKDSKKGFTQVAALKLSGIASDPGLDPAVAADIVTIETWLAGLGKLSCANLPTGNAAVAAAAGRIGTWINENHCTSESEPE